MSARHCAPLAVIAALAALVAGCGVPAGTMAGGNRSSSQPSTPAPSEVAVAVASAMPAPPRPAVVAAATEHGTESTEDGAEPSEDGTEPRDADALDTPPVDADTVGAETAVASSAAMAEPVAAVAAAAWMQDQTVLEQLRDRLGITTPSDDLDVLAAAIQPRAALALRSVGVDYGSRIDDADLLAAKDRIGLSVGAQLDGGDVVRIIDTAHGRLEAALLLAGTPFGSRIDEADLVAAASRLHLSVGSRVDGVDIKRIVDTAFSHLHRQTAGRVVDGLGYSRWTVDVPGGRSVVHRLMWKLQDPRIDVRTVPSGRFGGRASVTQAVSGRLSQGAVAAVNGGFWQGNGDPDGLLVTGGRLVSEPGSGPGWLRGARGAFGLGGQSYMVGRSGGGAQLESRGSGPMRIHGVDRPLQANDVVLYTPHYGAHTETPVGTLELPVFGLPLEPEGSMRGTALGLQGHGNTRIPPDGIVVAVSGKYRDQLSHVRRGDAVTLNVKIDEFGTAREALAGGPLLILQRRPTSSSEWFSEGFGQRHNYARHPRTAVGFTDDGWGMVVAVDGRQPGYSVGMTTAETAALMRAFGAVDALMVDGGGSTQMAVGPRLVNRHCCDGAERSVATSIVFFKR